MLTLIVLSAPPVINLVPVMSNVEQNTPLSASRLPGCGTSSMLWNMVPVAQSQRARLPLSPPENMTPSLLTLSVLTIAVYAACPELLPLEAADP